MENLKPSLQKRQKRRDKRMKEELIECYREGWRTKKAKGYQKYKNFEQCPAKEKIKTRHGGGSKYQCDNLEPLTRFLNTHIGKHWDKIYSELCQKIDKNTMLGKHLNDHL